MKKNLKENWPLYLIFLVVTVFALKEIIYDRQENKTPGAIKAPEAKEENKEVWMAPGILSDNTLTGDQLKMVSYGQELIAHTAKYLGPQGSVNQLSNGMNCQNCHLDAGARPWGNNYSAVASTYPKLRQRSGMIEGIPKRVNDCFERSLNGRGLDTTSLEMQSIVAYMEWLGKNVKKGEKPTGVGIDDLAYLDRAASPQKGQIVYDTKCQSCHAANGSGMKNPDGKEYVYPPLWGEHSYNIGAGLFRLSRFAGYVKDNMPFNQATHASPALTNEEAWDVAAFVNSQPRPKTDLSKDWPNIEAKPIDHPFGPYTDGFNEAQHKFGPFEPIVTRRNQIKSKASSTTANNTK